MTVYWKHRKSANWQPQLTIWNTNILTAIRATSRHCKMPSMKPRNISLHTPLLTQRNRCTLPRRSNIAQDLVNEGKVNQNAIDRQLENLASARTALEATAGFDFDVTGITTGYDTERGFRHPGALHTDADLNVSGNSSKPEMKKS